MRCVPLQDDSDGEGDGAEEEDADAEDSRGIGGWDKVDKLAEQLLLTSGLSVTNAQVYSLPKHLLL